MQRSCAVAGTEMKYESHFSPRSDLNPRLFLAALSLVLSRPARAQGLLPQRDNVSPSTASAHVPLMIGDQVPENVMVLDVKGTQRSLLSYKAAIEVFAVVFVSPGC